jgi:hypothetical protein
MILNRAAAEQLPNLKQHEEMPGFQNSLLFLPMFCRAYFFDNS